MQVNESRRKQLKLLPLAVAVFAGLNAQVALAQSAEAQAQTQEEATQQEATAESNAEVKELDRLTVTGSLIRRVEYDTISPVQVITADTSVAVGQVSASEFLQQSSVAAGSTQINNQFSGFVVEGGTGVSTLSLRGLGPQRTLVLLNGRRPGPAGTRGQVAAFDLNVLPSTILQRAEILKDGASSLYGSDAVAGVVNLITRKDFDGAEVTVSGRVPVDGGGEVYTVGAANGWNFDNGGVVVAAEYYLHEPLRIQDRDFFECGQDLVWDQQGNRIDREDRSIIAGTELGGCNNLYADTVIDAFRGTRYIPSPDGTTIGLIPGYRPRTNGTYRNGGQAFYEDVLNFDFYGDAQIIDRQERKSLYVSSDYLFGDISWTTELLYNNRQTATHRYRQFFPLVGGATAPFASFRYANSPDYVAPVPSGVAIPVMPFPSDQQIEVDYIYANTGLDGYFGDTWSWQANLSHSRSEGEYSGLGIVASRSGDVQYDDTAPRVDYFDPGFLNGSRMDELVATVGEWNTGETTYEQTIASGVLSGELFTLPAGAAGAAIGFEHRRFSIDDQPSTLSRNGDLWGQSSAQVTKGEDRVNEIFGEIELPLIADKPGFERVTFNASARAFQYDTVPGTDSVWKLGLGWQMTPSFQLRATNGTSYRAPGLFELFLGDQTSFAGQLAIDPCIDWQNSTNDFIRQNCAAAGVPGDFAGGASSATVISGGGFGILRPEKSKAFTTGLIFTPEFADFSVALDYFEMQINDQIDQLGAGAILGGCYGSPVYPNAFCNLFVRNSPTHPTAPNAIDTVRDSYININKQLTRGYDLLLRYENELAAGNFEVEGQFTYIMEDVVQLFDSAQASGYASSDRNGAIGRPKVVGNMRAAFERGDWTYTWGANYVHGTKNLDISPTFTYFSFPNAVRDIRAERRVYHSLSAQYRQDKWSVLVGVHNLFDDEPPVVSSGVASRYGNVPAFATQYDWYGRSLFARFNYKF
jgi:iron complex outermembrane receptor protein